MLIQNSTIWETRIQNVDALLSAAAGGRRELYYLATVCQVGLAPPLISIAPNPDYPICAAIEQSGFFGVNFLSREQRAVIAACVALDRATTDKPAAAAVATEETANGTPLLVESLQSLECRVLGFSDSGDHRTFVGEVIERRQRREWRRAQPHRFGGGVSQHRWLKRILCQTRVYDVLACARRMLRPPLSLSEGTSRFVGAPSPQAEDSQAGATPEGRTMSIRAEPDADLRSPERTRANAPRDIERKLAPARPGICLVGCGWWGAVHALELARMGSRIRRYFASRDQARAQEFARRFDGDGAFDGLDAALGDPRVDAVLLALPHDIHAKAAIRAVRAGKHVLVEKPLALRLADGDAMVRAADEAGVCLAVAEQYRLSPLVGRVRELMGDGLLGRVTLVDAGVAGTFRPPQAWKRDPETMGGGVLLDVGVHYIDVMRSWFGAVDRVWAVQPPQLYEDFAGEDAIGVSLEFVKGPVASLTLSWSGCRSPEAPNVELIGERGSLRLWFRRPYLGHTAPLPASHWSARLRRLLPWRIEELVRRHLPLAHERRIRVDSADLIGSHALIEDFVHAITTGSSPAIPGSEGLEDLRVVLAAYRAIESGVPVSLR